MPRDLITAETHAQRLTRLQFALTGAKAAYDAAALEAALNDSGDAGVREARAKIDEIEHQIAALDRARDLSKEEEKRIEVEQAAAEHAALISDTKSSAAQTKKAAAKVQRAIDQLLAAYDEYEAHRARFARNAGSLVRGKSNARLTDDQLGHRHEGAIIIGRLRKANIPGLDLMDPIDAMRAFEGKPFDELIGGRVQHALSLASIGAPELKA